MDDKYNEAIDLYMAGRYSEAIEAMAQSKTVAPDVYQQFVQQCRNLSPQSTASQSYNTKTHQSAKVPSFKSSKEKFLTVIIAVLVLANITVGFFWIKGCLNPKSVMEEDVVTVNKLLNTKVIPNRIDSISYALGCHMGNESLKNPSFTFDDVNSEIRSQVYAGMLRAMLTPISEERAEGIICGLQHAPNIEIEKYSKVGKLEGDAIFQGVVDVATSERTTLLSTEEYGEIVRNSFENK